MAQSTTGKGAGRDPVVFSPGKGNFLTSLVSRRIDRILVAATKADHLHHESHDRLQAIVRRLVDRSLEQADLSGADIKVLAMAAARSTREGTAKNNGENLPVIIGTPLKNEKIAGKLFDGRSETAIFPGDLPENPETVFQSDHGSGGTDADGSSVRSFQAAATGNDG